MLLGLASLKHECLRVVKLLTWQLEAPKKAVSENQMEAAVGLKVMKRSFCCTLWITHSYLPTWIQRRLGISTETVLIHFLVEINQFALRGHMPRNLKQPFYYSDTQTNLFPQLRQTPLKGRHWKWEFAMNMKIRKLAFYLSGSYILWCTVCKW